MRIFLPRNQNQEYYGMAGLPASQTYSLVVAILNIIPALYWKDWNSEGHNMGKAHLHPFSSHRTTS
jgi:hypothetical protein